MEKESKEPVNKDLAALGASVASVDAETVASSGVANSAPVDQPAAANYQQEASGAVAMFAALVVGYCPAAADLWPEDVQKRVALSLAPVLEKYQVSMGALPVELVLIVTTAPVLYQTAKLIAAQTASKKADKPKPDDSPKVEGVDLAISPQVALYQ